MDNYNYNNRSEFFEHLNKHGEAIAHNRNLKNAGYDLQVKGFAFMYGNIVKSVKKIPSNISEYPKIGIDKSAKLDLIVYPAEDKLMEALTTREHLELMRREGLNGLNLAEMADIGGKTEWAFRFVVNELIREGKMYRADNHYYYTGSDGVRNATLEPIHKPNVDWLKEQISWVRSLANEFEGLNKASVINQLYASINAI